MIPLINALDIKFRDLTTVVNEATLDCVCASKPSGEDGELVARSLWRSKALY